MLNMTAVVDGVTIYDRDSNYVTAQAAMNFLQRWVKQNTTDPKSITLTVVEI